MKTVLAFFLGLSLASVDASDASMTSTAAEPSCVDYAGAPCPPLACDGALCDTTTGSACGVVNRRSDQRSVIAFVGSAIAIAFLARARRRKESGR
jgi:hypothetical protein